MRSCARPRIPSIHYARHGVEPAGGSGLRSSSAPALCTARSSESTSPKPALVCPHWPHVIDPTVGAVHGGVSL
jgi:hypothetical protein